MSSDALRVSLHEQPKEIIPQNSNGKSLENPMEQQLFKIVNMIQKMLEDITVFFPN